MLDIGECNGALIASSIFYRTTDYIQLNSLTGERISRVTVNDIMGRIFIQSEDVSGTTEIKLSTTQLPVGTYFIHVHYLNGREEVRRVVKTTN